MMALWIFLAAIAGFALGLVVGFLLGYGLPDLPPPDGEGE